MDTQPDNSYRVMVEVPEMSITDFYSIFFTEGTTYHNRARTLAVKTNITDSKSSFEYIPESGMSVIATVQSNGNTKNMFMIINVFYKGELIQMVSDSVSTIHLSSIKAD